MNERDTSIIRLLSDLYRNCLQSEAEFRRAFSAAEDSDLRYLFSSYSLQRAKLARELGVTLAALGVEESRITRSECEGRNGQCRSSRTLLAECFRREKAAVREYRDALEIELPEVVEGLLRRQLGEVEAICERLQQLHSLAQPI